MLAALARPGSTLATIGCDLAMLSIDRGGVAGGYIQLYRPEAADCAWANALATDAERTLGGVAGDDDWTVDVHLTSVDARGLGGAARCCTAIVHVMATAATAAAALASREQLIATLGYVAIKHARA